MSMLSLYASIIGLATGITLQISDIPVAGPTPKHMYVAIGNAKDGKEAVRASALESGTSKAFSFRVPGYARIASSTFGQTAQGQWELRVRLAGAVPKSLRSSLVIEVSFPGTKAHPEDLVLVWAAGRYVYPSKPEVGDGHSALVRVSGGQVVLRPTVKVVGKELIFRWPTRGGISLGPPAWVMSCYLPSNIAPSKVVGGVEHQLTGYGEFVPVAKSGKPHLVSTLLPVFVKPGKVETP